MSNPLLKPNDPKFTRPSLQDAGGKNLFAEGGGTESNQPSASTNDNIYSSSAANVPYQPHYEVSQGHRGVLLLVLACTGLVGSLIGISSLTQMWVLGWVFSLLAIVPACCALVLGWHDLRAIRMGAMDPRGRNLTLIAFWLGALGFFSSVAMDAVVLYFAIYLLINLF